MNTYNNLTYDSNIRFATLYRVSTAKQVDDNEIPMQQNACKKYISKYPNGILINEYYEKGISGFKKDVIDRDVVQEIIKDAKMGKFDVLLIFASDRLCRIANQYTDTLKTLSKYVQIWTCNTGDITVRNHTDLLKTFVDGWQNEGESIKISYRTDEKHRQMTEEGVFHGGMNPYGYKFVKSGRYNERDKKQRKELYDLVIDEEESKIVKEIFNLSYEYGWGGQKIAKYLNEKGVKSRQNKQWSMQVINTMKKNPIYKGYPAYGKTSKKTGTTKRQNEELWTLSNEKVDSYIIVHEEIWDKVNEMRIKRRAKQKSNLNNSVPSYGKLLLAGFIFCGHCGRALITSYSTRKWTNKDGTIKTAKRIKYICSSKRHGLLCDGKTIYAQNKIEEPVIQYVKDFLSKISTDILSNLKENNSNNSIKEYVKLVNTKNNEKEKMYRELKALEDEIPKILLGESSLSKDMITNLINKKQNDIKLINEKIEEITNKMKAIKLEQQDIDNLKTALPTWEKIFEESPIDKKRMMLASIIDKVVVFDGKYEVYVKIHIQNFIDLCMHKKHSWERACVKNTYKKFIEEILIIDLVA